LVLYRLRFLLLGLLSCVGFPALAQPALTFSTLTTADGLSDNSIYSVLQDRQGFLWLGSQDGLNRYDGAAVRVFRHDPANPASLSRNWVTALAEDRAGQLWVSTGGSGICCYSPRTGRLRRFRAGPVPGSLSNDYVPVLLCDRAGRLWVGTDDGLNLYEPRTGRFRCLRMTVGTGGTARRNAIRALAQAADGSIWVGTGAGYVARLDERAGVLVPDPRWRLTSIITALCPAPNGGLWVGTEADGLLCLDAGQRPVRRFSGAGGAGQLPSSWVRTLFLDRQQQLWVGTTAGLARLLPATGTFVSYQHQPDQPHSLPDNGIRALSQDRTGRLWVGTDNGVASFDARPNPFEPLPLGGNSWCISEGPGSQLWLGTEQGLLRYDPATGQRHWFRHNPADAGSLAQDYIRAVLLDRRGGLWVATRNQGLDYRPAGATRFQHFRHAATQANSLADDLVHCLAEDSAGRLWVGTEGGLSCLDSTRMSWTTYRRDPAGGAGLPDNFVSAVFPDRRGRVWVGTRRAGLARLEPRTGRVCTYPAREQQPGCLSGELVRSITADHTGRLWVGTEGGGLCRLDDEARGRFTVFREAQGLPEDVVYGVLEDAWHRLWLSSNKGLTCLTPATGEAHVFDSRDGLGQDEFNAGAYHRGRSGRLYFGGVNGVVMFRPGAVRTNPTPPAVVFTGLRKRNQLVELDTSITQRRGIRLGPGDHAFSLEFAALNFIQPDKNRFAYQLEGFDRGWVNAGARHEATYTNLAPGRYTFRVRAANNAGVWNQRGAALLVVVEPAWYQTWWFRALVVLTTGGLLYLLYLLRVRQLLALERVRYGIARDLHDDVGSTLSSISLLAQVARTHYHSPHPERAAALLEQIGDNSTRMLGAMSDIVWTISPTHDTLEDVIARMRAFASEILEARDIDLLFRVAPGLPRPKLPMQVRRDLFLLYKEAVNNLAKYARCRTARIGLDYDAPFLILTVQDDGVGFDPAAPAVGSGNGLANMRARAQAMRGELSLTTRLGQGTTWQLRVPLAT